MVHAKVTRREWAAALAATATAARAQTQPGAPQTAAGLKAEASGEVRRDIGQLDKFPLPAATEPAFVFKP